MKGEKLDRRVTLQHEVLTRDATYGEEVKSYVTYATVWAKKEPRNSRKFFAAQQVNANITEIFSIRYRTDVLSGDRIVLDGLSYEILPTVEIGRREGLEIQATAVKS